MQRHGFIWWEILIGLFSIAIIAAFVISMVLRANYNEKSAHCAPNLKQIGLGMMLYALDYDDKYPPVAIAETRGGVFSEPYSTQWSTPPYGWADSLQPYLTTSLIYQCPLEPNTQQAVPSQHGYTDYWYNRNLAGKNKEKVKNSAMVILLGDGNDGHDETTARYSLSQLPEAWRDNKNSPAYRHREGANYAFADGHAKWLKPENVTNAPVLAGEFTFAVR